MPLYNYNNPGINRTSFTTSTNNSTNSNNDNTPLSRMTDSERQETIKEVFLLVYGQEATSRDISYYRYSALTKTQLILKLIKSDKHKQLVEKGTKYDEVLNNKNSLELKVKFLQNQIDSIQQEFITLKQLLDEKNRHIHQLREHINTMSGVNLPTKPSNPYGVQTTPSNPNSAVQDTQEQVPTYVPIPNKNYYSQPTKLDDAVASNGQSLNASASSTNIQLTQNVQADANTNSNLENTANSIQNRPQPVSNSNDNRGFLKRFIDYLLSKLI